MTKEGIPDIDEEIWQVAAGLRDMGTYEAVSPIAPTSPYPRIPLAAQLPPIIPSATLSIPKQPRRRRNSQVYIDPQSQPVPYLQPHWQPPPPPVEKVKRPYKPFLDAKQRITRATRTKKLAEYHSEMLDSIKYDPIMDITTSSRFGKIDTTSTKLISANNSRESKRSSKSE